MALELSYDTKEAIPAGKEDLFTEVGGKWSLTEIKGLKTQADVDALDKSLKAEREGHKATKGKLKIVTDAIGDRKPEDLVSLLDGYEDLKLKAEANGGKVDEAAIKARVDSAVATNTSRLNRQIDEQKKALDLLSAENTGLKTKDANGKITSALRKAGGAAKIVETAFEDIELIGPLEFTVTEDGNVVTKDSSRFGAGMSPDDFFSNMKEKRPHWWPPSTGGGATGGVGGAAGGKNPWGAGTAWNTTEQGRYEEKHGAAKADQMAQAAGCVDRNQVRPPVKK